MKNFISPIDVKIKIGEITQPIEYGTMPDDPYVGEIREPGDIISDK